MKNIVFKSFKINEDQYIELLQKLNDFCFNLEDGEGVQVIEETIDYARCIYCYETIYMQNMYNPSIGDFEKTKLKKIELIPFIIDLKYQTLDIFGTKQKCSRVIDMIGKITRYRIPVIDIQVNPIKILLACSDRGISYCVKKVKIVDYVFFDNIIGNCILDLSEYQKTEEVLKKYEKQIVSFSSAIKIDDAYSITFYKSGAISIYKEFEDIKISLIRTLKCGL